MSKRPRRNHSPAFKAKVALAAVGKRPGGPAIIVRAEYAGREDSRHSVSPRNGGLTIKSRVRVGASVLILHIPGF